MPTAKKQATVEELTERFSQATIAITTTYQGLPVPVMSDMRQKLRERGLEYRVVKNTLASIAADMAGRQGYKEILKGPTAVALGFGDPVEAAKALDEVVRAGRLNISIIGGVMDGQVLSSAEVTRLAALPPRAELLARLVGQMQAPITRLVSTLAAPLSSLASVLQQRVQQLERSGAAS